MEATEDAVEADDGRRDEGGNAPSSPTKVRIPGGMNGDRSLRSPDWNRDAQLGRAEPVPATAPVTPAPTAETQPVPEAPRMRDGASHESWVAPSRLLGQPAEPDDVLPTVGPSSATWFANGDKWFANEATKAQKLSWWAKLIEHLEEGGAGARHWAS